MKLLQMLGIISILFLVGCAQQITQKTTPTVKVEDSTTGLNWKDIQLTDIRTGNTFKISDFKGKPILLESFAVWCPTCTQQQKEIKQLHEEVGDSVISISLNTDPNEDREQILDHVNRNGFNWLYAISPVDFTKQLIDEFGVGIVNAPRAPVVHICEDQSTKILGSGVKSVTKLKSVISAGC